MSLIKLVVALSFLGIGAIACLSKKDKEKIHPKPNIIIILADDLGPGDPEIYNPDSKIPTPHINALAERGIRFTDAHSPSAVCTPTRYGLSGVKQSSG